MLVVDRADHPVGEVEPAGVVLGQARDHHPAGLVTGDEPAPGAQLEPQGEVERLGHRIVQGRAGAAHRLDDPDRRADPGQFATAELPALIAM
jgi:hypothetical protein